MLKKRRKVTSEQGPQEGEKEKPDAIPLPDDTIKKGRKIRGKKTKSRKIEDEIKQVSEFEKDELFDPDSIAALIDKSKEETAETTKKNNKITQSQDKNVDSPSLTLSEEDALKPKYLVAGVFL